MTGKFLENRVSLVTGASRGIGRAIALALAGAGSHIALNYLSRRTEAEETCREIEGLGCRVLALQGDVSLAAAASGIVAAAEKSLGPVEILVNNAGISRPQALEQITERDWDDILTVNLKSAFLMTQAILPRMRAAKWGRIINITSVAAQLGGVVGPHYAASKAGMIGLTHGYATALAKEGITVNAIAPALIATDMVFSNPRAQPDVIPAGRFGTVEEVASVCVMLASNGYINGQTINVNGGWYMT